MTFKILPVESTGSSVRYGANDIRKIMRYLSNYNLKDDDVTDVVNIATETKFNSEKFSIGSIDNSFKYIFKGGTIAADRTIILPDMGSDATMSLAANSAANDWGTNMQTLRNTYLQLMNPANTFSYIVNTSAITANRNLIVPLITVDDTLVVTNLAQTLYNKTFVSPTFSAITLETDSNIIKHSTTNNNGDLLVNNGTQFARFARGNANQVPIMNPTGTGIIWVDQATLTTGGSGGGGGGGSSSASSPTTAGNTIEGSWYGTSTTGGSGVFNNFLTNTSNVTPVAISDTSGRIGLRYNFFSDDDRGGFRTNSAFVTRLNNPELIVRYKYYPLSATHTSSVSYRVVIGFTSDPSADYGIDNAADDKHVFLWYRETDDAQTAITGNNGVTTTGTDTTVSVPTTDSNINTVRLFADDANSRWGVSLNNASATYFTMTNLPVSTARLGIIVQFENEGNDDRSFELYGVTFRAKVI